MTRSKIQMLLIAGLILSGSIVALRRGAPAGRSFESGTRDLAQSPQRQEGLDRVTALAAFRRAGTNRTPTPSNSREDARAAVAPSPSDQSTSDSLLRKLPPRPRMRDVEVLSLGAEAALIARFHSIPRLADRQQITRVLAFGGGEASADVLWRTLTVEFADQELDEASGALMIFIPELLGVLSERVPRALDFIVEGSDPAYWRRLKLWREPDGRDQATVLAQACVCGLGYSTQARAAEVLERLLDSPPSDDLSRISSSAVSAAFHRAVIEEDGLVAAMDGVLYDLNPECIARLTKWRLTPEGRRWSEWGAGQRSRRSP
jgi:hypothetical protein